jgi:hypothetical protein
MECVLDYRLKCAITFYPTVLSHSNFYKGYRRQFCLGGALERLLGDEDVWSPILEYRLNRAITFDPTVRSHLNVYRGF